MPTYTKEPAGLAFINNMNMATFGPLISQVCWLVGSLAFTWLACFLMTRPDYYTAVGAFDDHGLRQMVMVSRETTRALGNSLATLLLAAWTGKTIAGVVESNNKRKSAPEYATVLEAKAKVEAAKVSGPAPTGNGGEPPVVTSERPAMRPSTAAPIIPDEELIPEGGQP